MNKISIGVVTRYNDEFTTYDQTTIGIAIRPFLNHRLTVGADWTYLNNDKVENICPETCGLCTGTYCFKRFLKNFEQIKIQQNQCF